MDVLPKLRAGIEAYPATHQGRNVLLLRDRTGVSQDLALNQGATEVLSYLNGIFSARDIQIALMRKCGLGLIALEDIQGLVDLLDRHFFLDNENYRNHLQEISAEFRRQTLRRAAHAGVAYPSNGVELRKQLETYFLQPQGPGQLQIGEPGRNISGLIVPHIDFQRGGHCYAWGYSAFPEGFHADLYVILGTCHLPMTLPFALTKKAFETPMGVIPCAEELAEAVAEQAGYDLFVDELAQRSEHTIEFQVLFLQYLLREDKDRPLRILPILCGGFQEMLTRRLLPSKHEPYQRSLEAIADVLSSSGQRMCVIASADLAHLGPQFGDPYPVQHSALALIEQEDRALLRHVLNGDSEGFYRRILAEGDRRRICGLPPIYTLLSLLHSSDISLLNYGQAYHPQATVTFASIGLWSRDRPLSALGFS